MLPVKYLAVVTRGADRSLMHRAFENIYPVLRQFSKHKEQETAS